MMKSNALTLPILLALLVGCSEQSEDTQIKEPVEIVYHSNHFQALWSDSIEYAANEPLWMFDYAYDASASLMVPMHYAYKYPERFEEDPRPAFARLVEDSYFNIDIESIRGTVTGTQYLYFITQYLKLVAQQGELNPEILYWARNEVVELWSSRQAFHWDTSLEFTGVKEKLEWLLSKPETRYKFYRAVVDVDWFTLAAINDLVYLEKLTGESLNLNHDEVFTLTKSLLESYGEYDTQGNWFFQRGVWSDHRDYAYAGHQEMGDNLEVKQIDNIGIDSSHLHRLPLWLDSFADAANDQYFQQIKNAHRQTYENLVLENVTDEYGNFTLLQRNFSTGENGIYRYNYVTQGSGNGYQAYQLSGTLFVGYYTFLDSKEYQQGMLKMASQFPLSNSALEYYVGPNTSRERHPLFEWPAYFDNGFAEVFSLTAACYHSELADCDPYIQ
ncbi:hypothetical protein [Pseudoalteromonas sp. GB56]